MSDGGFAVLEGVKLGFASFIIMLMVVGECESRDGAAGLVNYF